jgi:hypothetical protein
MNLTGVTRTVARELKSYYYSPNEPLSYAQSLPSVTVEDERQLELLRRSNMRGCKGSYE